LVTIGSFAAHSQQLRILVSDFTENHSYLPREKLPIDYGANLAIQYAKQNGIEPVIVYAKKNLLATALIKGYGDLIASSYIANDEKATQISNTHAIRYTNQQLVHPKSLTSLPSYIGKYYFYQKNFNGIRIGVQKSAAYWDTVKKLQEKNNKIKTVVVADNKTPDEVLDNMVEGKFEATVSDSAQIEIALKYRKDIKVAYTMKEKNAVTWAVRKDNPELLKSINAYIEKYRLLNDIPSVFKGDLAELKKRNEIRLITINHISSYFIWKNKLMGFEYELIKKFAKENHIALKVLVAKNEQQMIQWLLEGRGDIVSAGIRATNEIKEQALAMTNSYNRESEVILQRIEDKPIESIEELEGRTIAISQEDVSWNLINQYQQDNTNFQILEISSVHEPQTIMNRVAANQYDIAVIDANALAIENAWRNDLQSSLVLTKNIGQHWLVRESNTQLLIALNQFIKKHRKSKFYNITYNKYFKNSRKLFSKNFYEQFQNDHISPYDELIKKYSHKYNFNWLLISAQINQESQFNPKAKSLAGAVGLMQMMPRTAKKLQVSNLEIPKNSIAAGLKYMDWIRQQYKDKMAVEDQIWFTLAAYNAGVGHVQDARTLAKKLKLDPNRWFDQTEKAMLMLSKKKYASQARYGYVRGSEPVYYVRQIRHIYQLYQKTFDKRNKLELDKLEPVEKTTEN
ncbi:MAG: transporter substrate-binding domain-containing protein, partial [Gammaproteobacteria bacterium]|nr:transporter substrate-binding domain-containing protein [Gammaproteobacteria bacterium]